MRSDEPSINTPIGDRELEALRRHGFGVAYRMLGSVSDAEDVAQEGAPAPDAPEPRRARGSS